MNEPHFLCFIQPQHGWQFVNLSVDLTTPPLHPPKSRRQLVPRDGRIYTKVCRLDQSETSHSSILRRLYLSDHIGWVDNTHRVETDKQTESETTRKPWKTEPRVSIAG